MNATLPPPWMNKSQSWKWLHDWKEEMHLKNYWFIKKCKISEKYEIIRMLEYLKCLIHKRNWKVGTHSLTCRAGGWDANASREWAGWVVMMKIQSIKYCRVWRLGKMFKAIPVGWEKMISFIEDCVTEEEDERPIKWAKMRRRFWYNDRVKHDILQLLTPKQ